MKKYLHILPKFLFCFIIIIWVYLVYGQVRSHDFITLDDNEYVYDNSHVQNGLTLDSIRWAFTNTDAGIWIPVTWLSLMIDYELFGLNPGIFHITNVVFHIANVLLLFLLFSAITKAPWESMFLSGLFALHPLQVESVAWITERKDVLSIFFMLIALISYFRYVKQPTIYKYCLVFIIYTLGLLAKPMIVTFPLVLLLMDYWPLKRFSSIQGLMSENRAEKTFHHSDTGTINRHILMEKIPFLALSGMVSVITLIAVNKNNAFMQLDSLTPVHRLSNSIVSYVTYIMKIFWPGNLAIFYPYESGALPLWKIIGALLILSVITAVAIRLRKRYPYFLFGWIWYIGTLIPVIGIFQTGSQSMADRFTYMPIIGVFTMIVWGVASIKKKRIYQRILTSVFAVTFLLLLSVTSWFQISYWRDSITLFSHAIKVTSSNWLAHNSLGIGFERQGNLSGAAEHYKKAIFIDPNYFYAHYNLARVYELLGNYAEASHHLKEVLDFKPDFAEANYNLALTLVQQGKMEEAIAYYKHALKINPHFAEAHYNMALALQHQGKFDEAAAHYKETLHINNENYFAHYNLARIYTSQGNSSAAEIHYSEALRLNPDFAETYYHLGNIYAEKGHITESIEHYKGAIRINPGYTEALNTLGNVLEYQGKLDEAVVHYLKALGIKPDNPVLHRNLAGALQKLGKTEEADAHFREAKSLDGRTAQPDDVENTSGM